MKHLIRPILISLAALATGLALGAAPTSQVTVNFHEPDKFTDARTTMGGSTDDGHLRELTHHLQKVVDRYIAPDQRLEVTFTDIDLAGDFVPGHNPNSTNIRVIRDIFIPRQTILFRLLDADGRVLKEGERRLSDLNFMSNPRLVGRDEPLFFDKELLNDWLQREFKT